MTVVDGHRALEPSAGAGDVGTSAGVGISVVGVRVLGAQSHEYLGWPSSCIIPQLFSSSDA
jgi:hypothetical protein